jgi:hypothetical protein
MEILWVVLMALACLAIGLGFGDSIGRRRQQLIDADGLVQIAEGMEEVLRENPNPEVGEAELTQAVTPLLRVLATRVAHGWETMDVIDPE